MRLRLYIYELYKCLYMYILTNFNLTLFINEFQLSLLKIKNRKSKIS